jgi:flagellar assembly protein FliH
MKSAAKFTFDTEFLPEGDRVAPAAKARQRKTVTNEELEQLAAQARSEGESNAAARAADQLERTIAALTVSLRAALDSSAARIEDVRAEPARIALAMARRIAPAAIAALPAADVEMALRQAMHQAIIEPRITLRAAPDVIAAIQPRIDAITHEEGYDGRVMLSADPFMTGADCRIEWRGGGAERSEATIEEALERLIANRFSNNQDLPNTELKG